MNDKIKIGTEVWFMSNDELLHGIVNEVYRNIIVVCDGRTTYAIRKDSAVLSRRELLEIFDNAVGIIKESEKRLEEFRL